MRKRFARVVAALSVAAAALTIAPAALADNPASAPANQIGTTVAGIAQTVNFGQTVCRPAATQGQEDNAALTFLGLTPPGNTP